MAEPPQTSLLARAPPHGDLEKRGAAHDIGTNAPTFVKDAQWLPPSSGPGDRPAIHPFWRVVSLLGRVLVLAEYVRGAGMLIAQWPDQMEYLQGYARALRSTCSSLY
jgi:hypothetical protein